MVTIGISIVLADLMLWVFGGNSYQIQTPAWLRRADRAAVRHRGQVLGRGGLSAPIPIVRLVIFAASVVIGVAMWLALNRTRIGMIVRAGVDDRDILVGDGRAASSSCSSSCSRSAPGSPGMAGVVGGTFQSLSPGEDTRFLLASLVVVIVGGMGSIPGAALGAVIVGLAEQIGLGLLPDLCDRADVPDHGARAGRAAAGPAGEALAMALAESPTRRAPAPATAARLAAAHRPGAACSSPLVLVIMPPIANGFVLIQIFGLVAHPRHRSR